MTVAQVAVGSVESSLQLDVAGPLTTGDVAQMAEYAGVEWAKHAFDETSSVTVVSRPLDVLLAEHGIAPGFELLIVDVEGVEAEVLRGFDVAHWRPVMMVWELTDTHPDLRLRRTDSIQVGAALVAHGYRIAYKDAINTVFVRADHMAAQA